MAEPRALYAPLLSSPCAQERVEGIRRWEERSGGIADLQPLLDDDAPLVLVHGGRRLVIEVRAVALVALQDRHRLLQRPWALGEVRVREGMSAEEIERRLAALPSDRLGAVASAVDQALERRVRPAAADRELCRGYLALQRLGEVPYQLQSVDPETWLTPLQIAIHATQLRSPRPTPHLRFDGSRGPVGYLYRRDGQWVFDLDESPLAREIQALVGGWMGALRGGVSRIRFGADGEPLLHENSKAFLSDGLVPHDTDAPLEYLRSVGAFAARHFCCEVVP